MKIVLFLIPLLFFIVFPKQSVSADTGSESAMVSPTPVVTSSYTLPYPGILPDNPLYALKAIRDRIIIFFISDPLKKSSFYLLQSDKKLEASLYLLKKGRTDLALSTLSKSTNYLSLAVSQAQLIQKSGENVGNVQGKLADAVVKHILVVQDMQVLLPQAHKNALATEEKRLEDLQQVVLRLSSRQ